MNAQNTMYDSLFNLDLYISSVQLDADKAYTVAGDLIEDYFDKADVSVHDLTPDSMNSSSGSLTVISDYNRYATYSQILFDYLYNIKKVLEDIEGKILSLSKEAYEKNPLQPLAR